MTKKKKGKIIKRAGQYFLGLAGAYVTFKYIFPKIFPDPDKLPEKDDGTPVPSDEITEIIDYAPPPPPPPPDDDTGNGDEGGGDDEGGGNGNGGDGGGDDGGGNGGGNDGKTGKGSGGGTKPGPIPTKDPLPAKKPDDSNVVAGFMQGVLVDFLNNILFEDDLTMHYTMRDVLKNERIPTGHSDGKNKSECCDIMKPYRKRLKDENTRIFY